MNITFLFLSQIDKLNVGQVNNKYLLIHYTRIVLPLFSVEKMLSLTFSIYVQ